MGVRLGAIADDYTGATDLGSVLREQGLSVIQYNGIPQGVVLSKKYDVVIIALKSRSIPVSEAIDVSLKALKALTDLGAEQIYFKYCSTFDSTAEGNIGPVTEALMTALQTTLTIACPAFPVNGRSVYKGHLFVGDKLLSDTHMRYHPLHPMTDANLINCLKQQTSCDIELIDYTTVEKGSDAIRGELDRFSNTTIVVIDAIKNDHLENIGLGTKQLRLLTGASGLGLGIAQAYDTNQSATDDWKSCKGRRAVIAGSCSAMTLSQIEIVKGQWPTYKIDTQRVEEGDQLLIEIKNWIEANLSSSEPLLIYSSESSEGRNDDPSLSRKIEVLMGHVGELLFEMGVAQLIIAGGETSGAVLGALHITQLEIGPTIAPGVPWTNAVEINSPMSLALKSGNFGSPTFFQDAFNLLDTYED